MNSYSRTIKEKSPLNHRYDWLKATYKENVIFFRAAGKYIALTGTDTVPEEVVMIEEKKVPEWKQYMNIQMGRRPRTTTESRRLYRTETVNNPQTALYKLWETVPY